MKETKGAENIEHSKDSKHSKNEQDKYKSWKSVIALIIFAFFLMGIGYLLTGCGKREEALSENSTIGTETAEDITEKNQQGTSGDSYNEENDPFVSSSEENNQLDTSEPSNPYDFTLMFAGDMNFTESRPNMVYYSSQPNGIYDCISKDLIDEMKEADIMWINNEFTYSTQGSPLPDKMWTFRTDPSNVNILNQLGVDVAGVANNHIYDYGEQAFYDTLDTLTGAGISYVGAGKNLEEAMSPVYVEVDGKTVAFVAASRAEKFILTPEAGENSPGVLRCYDPTRLIEEIKEAKQNADFVVACVHWGTEESTVLEDAQLTTGKQYLDAGADAIIGAHSHCLQGLEFYDDKPIIYSLGNYWFSDATDPTMMVELHFFGDDENQQLQLRIVPAMQSGCQTYMPDTQEEKDKIYDYLTSISVNVEIGEDGIVTESE